MVKIKRKEYKTEEEEFAFNDGFYAGITEIINKQEEKQEIRESRPKTYTGLEVINKILNLRETLSNLEHEQWSHWTKYFLENIVDKKDGLIRLDLVQRWNKQTKSTYKTLSEEEKDLDRVWADKIILRILQEFMTSSGFKSAIEKSGLKGFNFSGGKR